MPEYMVAYDPRKVVYGTVALDGSGATTVDSGLRVIDHVSLLLNSSDAPALSTSTLSYTVSGGTLSIYPWKPTGAGDTTLVASDGTETVAYVITGRE